MIRLRPALNHPGSSRLESRLVFNSAPCILLMFGSHAPLLHLLGCTLSWAPLYRLRFSWVLWPQLLLSRPFLVFVKHAMEELSRIDGVTNEDEMGYDGYG